jgi:diadenylate cyclase
LYHEPVADRFSVAMVESLETIAPGRPLRDGLDRILQANKGALVVVGDGPEVLAICSGGFLLDSEFSPQRMAELAKMDGAIILASDASRIARANVHLVPNPDVATAETGTRHRTAERVARSINVPVIAVSEDMAVITVYRNDVKHRLDTIARLLTRGNQALQTLERYRTRLDAVTSSLSALEVEDLVTVRDVATVLQRAEMVRRIAEEVDGNITELGDDGRLLRLQLEELMAGVEDDRRQVILDYLPDDERAWVDETLGELTEIPTERLLDAKLVAALLRLTDGTDLEGTLQPRGYRLLSKVPRLSESVIAAIVDHLASLQKVMRATVEDLEAISGVSGADARMVKEGLSRIAEASILDRFG